MDLMNQARLPFLVGGAYAFARYTGIERHTKDFDVFIRREDFDRAANLFSKAGYETELTFPHWLGKAFKAEDFVDPPLPPDPPTVRSKRGGQLRTKGLHPVQYRACSDINMTLG